MDRFTQADETRWGFIFRFMAALSSQRATLGCSARTDRMIPVKWTCCCRTEPVTEDQILDILDSPASDSKSVITASSSQKVTLSPALAPLNKSEVFPCHVFLEVKLPFFYFLVLFLRPLCLSALLFLFPCVAAWPRLTFVHLRTQSCLKSLKSCRWVAASPIGCCSCVSCSLVFINVTTRPSGKQNRWAALSIPPPTEGTFTSKNVHACVSGCVSIPLYLKTPFFCVLSVPVSVFNNQGRPAAHSPVQVGQLLDGPPGGEARGRESHFFPIWPPSRQLWYYGARQRGQDLPQVLSLACESHLYRNMVFAPLLVFSFHRLSFQNHHSFTAVDPCLGPLVLSVCLEEAENRLRVILRSFKFFQP